PSLHGPSGRGRLPLPVRQERPRPGRRSREELAAGERPVPPGAARRLAAPRRRRSERQEEGQPLPDPPDPHQPEDPEQRPDSQQEEVVDRERDLDGSARVAHEERAESREVDGEADHQLKERRDRRQRDDLPAERRGGQSHEQGEQGDEDPEPQRPAPGVEKGEGARRRLAVARAAARRQGLRSRPELQDLPLAFRQDPVAPDAFPGERPQHVRPSQAAVPDHQDDTGSQGEPHRRRMADIQEKDDRDEQEQQDAEDLKPQRAGSGAHGEEGLWHAHEHGPTGTNTDLHGQETPLPSLLFFESFESFWSFVLVLQTSFRNRSPYPSPARRILSASSEAPSS